MHRQRDTKHTSMYARTKISYQYVETRDLPDAGRVTCKCKTYPIDNNTSRPVGHSKFVWLVDEGRRCRMTVQYLTVTY